MEFELKKEQKEYLEKEYNLARDLYHLQDILPTSPLFIKNHICIKKKLLKELSRRGYLAFRVKKINGNFVCFIFEVFTPVKPRFTDKNIIVEGLTIPNVKQAVLWMKGVITGKIRFGYIDSYTAGTVHYLVYPSLLPKGGIQQHYAEDPNFTYSFSMTGHAHPFSSAPRTEIRLRPEQKAPFFFSELGAVAALSAGDFNHMATENCYFLFEYNIDATRFLEKVKKLDAGAFDNGGFLKFNHIKSIAEELANELIEDNSLKALYDTVGMPLVAARRNDGQHIAVYTKLKIT